MIRLQWRTLLHCRQAGKELENKQKNIPSQDPSIRHESESASLRFQWYFNNRAEAPRPVELDSNLVPGAHQPISRWGPR